VDQGTLVVSPASHRLSSLQEMRDTYGQSSVGKDGVQSGWLTDDPTQVNHAKEWVTCDFRAGDICILNLDILHLSSTNTTSRFRLSCDTRWQPASAPMNPRLTAGGGKNNTSPTSSTTSTTSTSSTSSTSSAASPLMVATSCTARTRRGRRKRK